MVQEELTLSWTGVQHLITDSLPRIEQGEFERLMGVSRGGLVPMTIIAGALNIKDVASVGISAYEDKKRVGDWMVTRAPDPEEFNDIRTLIIDDIADTGGTMSVLARMYPKAKRLVLVGKPQGVAHVNGYLQAVNQNVWVNFPWENIQKKGSHPPKGK